MRRNDPHWQPGCVLISAQTRVTPYLLRMKWKGHVLHRHPKLSWGYLVPRDKAGKVLLRELMEQEGGEEDEEGGEGGEGGKREEIGGDR